MAVDWTSPEALGLSHNVNHCLTQFNVAVFSRVSDALNVWKIQLADETSGSQYLRLGEHLSAFSTAPYNRVTEARLYGAELAYRFSDHGSTS